ncbi:MAG: M48 family metallopeptidase [Holophagales bacterium]|nr:M48 family metallopeptidase [Holophagales bacterium]MYH26254.1 M48 family metallopeptidase [Holophagales bacterium]
MSAIPCRYFDGHDSRCREAAIAITTSGEWVVAFEDSAERLVATEVRIPNRISDTPRFIHLPGGAVCEVRDNDALDELRARLRRDREPRSETFGRLVHRLDSTWRGAAAALVVTAAILYSFTRWGAPAVAGLAVAATPQGVEALIGENALTLFQQFNLLEPSELEPNRRNEILAEFAAMREDMGVENSELRFHSADGLGPNAFALPGGTIVITDQLVDLAEHDEEIVAVLAHELGHVNGRHVIRRLAQTSSMLVLWTAFTGDVSVAALALLGPERLIALSYSRSFEREADQFATDYLFRAGIAPTRLGDILERLEERAGTGNLPSFLASHPGAKLRARNAEEAAEGLSSHPETSARANNAEEVTEDAHADTTDRE